MIPQRVALLVLVVFSFASTFLRADDAQVAAQDLVNYSRDIRPILSNHCFKCHGPDANERKSGLRLDVRENALRGGDSGQAALAPGKPAESQLVARIFSQDPDQSMPPAAANRPLSQAQKELLRRWVQQGAEWRMHWSFESAQRPALPRLDDAAWPRNAIDHFIAARLQAEGLKPSPEADQTTLIRRATLDLTGLPPTPAEIDAYLSDNSPAAYEKLIDRLLESPRYGERMALDWLDASRYADTHGFHIDSHRDMWKWREWVIEAFNRNLPFDQFTVEQLAGDLLPSATVSQKLASGFNRNHMINFEGGAIPEEYLTAYIVDRVNTTGTVWLGLSVGCAQCHDHKYDPIRQQEYYQLYAFFNNVPENGLDGRKGNAAPLVRLPSTEQQQQADRFAAAIKQIDERLAASLPEIDAAQAEWEKTALVERDTAWTVLDPTELKSAGGAVFAQQPDQSILVTGNNPATDTYTLGAKVDLSGITAVRLEALPDDSLKAKGPGRSENGNLVLTDVRATLSAADSEQPTPLKFKAATADYSQAQFPVANAIDGNPGSGWAVHPEVGKLHTAVFEFEQPIRSSAVGTLTITLDFQSQFGQHQLGKFRLAITSSPEPHAVKAIPPKVAAALAVEAEKRSEAQKKELRDYFRANHSTATRQLNDELAKLKKSQTDLEAAIPTSMVMQELDKPRDTFLLVRGQYDKKGDKVQAGVPASLPPLPAAAPHNRLGLAQWLVDPAHPLTSRVMVNRCWQMCFGHGLVKTSEDFGSQGEWPSHPELLDWLATEFVSSGWDVKRLVRLMVTSAAYRQSAAVTPALLAKDPENRLLARSSRLRLQAEFIRDLALAASGLLNGQIGGPSVYPYQPPGLWEEMAFGKEFTAQAYTQSHGADLYRRSMYTFWKRTVPPATMSTFDAPDRETCTVRRARTNTPLQALVLMNDPTYVEASRKLAERLLTEGGSMLADQRSAGGSPAQTGEPPVLQTADRIAQAYKLSLARQPTSAEISVLTQLLHRQLTMYRRDAAAAARLLAVGESKRDERLDAAELAAWTTLVSVILNLDETITRG